MRRSQAWPMAAIALVALGATIFVRDLVQAPSCEHKPKGDPGVSRVDLGAQVIGVGAGHEGLWVTRRLYGGIRPYDLIELDPVSGKMIGKPLDLPVHSRLAALGGGSVWVATSSVERRPATTLNRVDPRSRRIVSRLPLGRGASAIALDDGGVWVGYTNGNKVVRFDLRGRHVVSSGRLDERPDRILVGEGAVWVGPQEGFDGGRLFRIDRTTGNATGEVQGSLGDIGLGSLWVVGSGPPNGQLVRIDPRTLKRTGPALGLESLPAKVVVVGNDVWAGTHFYYCETRPGPSAGEFGWFRINPVTLKSLSRAVHVGPNPGTPAFADGNFWIPSDIGNYVIRIDLAAAAKARPPADVPVIGSS